VRERDDAVALREVAAVVADDGHLHGEVGEFGFEAVRRKHGTDGVVDAQPTELHTELFAETRVQSCAGRSRRRQ